MSNVLPRLKYSLQERGVDVSVLGELETDYAELVKKAAKSGFTASMLAARDLLGLNHNTKITRAEPKTCACYVY